jgi:DNA-binding LacI/PurR family transcriptional regulator
MSNGKGGITKRASTKQNKIFSTLRREIVEGVFPPGDRLPLRDKIEQRFGVSWYTIYRVFERLRQDGFVEFRGRSGTFVCEHPPHLSRYAHVFPRYPESDSLFKKTLMQVAERYEREHDLALPVFFGGRLQVEFDTEYERLVDDIYSDRLAGLMVYDIAEFWAHTPVLEADIPRVFIVSPSDNEGYHRVCFSFQRFTERALEHLEKLGCKRAGVISAMPHKPVVEHLNRRLAESPMETRPYWLQYIAKGFKEEARHLAHLLLRDLTQSTERPIGLVVNDDNIVHHVTQGIRDAGLSPEEVHVVAHCNYPCPPPTEFPVTFLGFDVETLVERSIRNIDMQRRGELEDSSTQLIEPEFDEER